MADFWLRHRGKYPALASVKLPLYNLAGIAASALCYIALLKFSRQPAVLPAVQETL